MRSRLRFLSGLVYCTALVLLFFTFSGLIYLDPDGPASVSQSVTAERHFTGSIAGFSAILLVVSGLYIWRRSAKLLLFHTLAVLAFVPITLMLGELATRPLAPSWPAIGLHGVHPDHANQVWIQDESRSAAVPFNSWGQRDRERSIQPDPQFYRIGFIGDSFLEESTAIPLSLRFEQLLDRGDVEVLNLGVSGSAPDEYYYRLTQLAVPLSIDHCVLFLYTGNDFTDEPRSLHSFLGIAAVYPRESLLSQLGFLGLNHFTTNTQRPLIRSWMGAEGLAAKERSLEALLARNEDQAVLEMFLSQFPTDQLAERLERPQIADFLKVVRRPDKGLFRSHYLRIGLRAAALGDKPWEPMQIDAAHFWITKAIQACDSARIKFTLVIIPEAFQVDDRMRNQWLPLADMRATTRSCRKASERLVAMLPKKVPIIDLHEVLQQQPGSYLNLDGHWSDQGVEVVASALRKQLDLPPR